MLLTRELQQALRLLHPWRQDGFTGLWRLTVKAQSQSPWHLSSTQAPKQPLAKYRNQELLAWAYCLH